MTCRCLPLIAKNSMSLKPILFLLTLGISFGAFAGELVAVDTASIRGMPPGQQTTTAYMRLRNISGAPLKLLGGSADWAQRIEVHSHEMTDGIMRMRKVEALQIDKDAAVDLEPGGYHLMVFGLQRTLKDGEKLTLQLQFESGTQSIEAPVKSVLAERDEHHHHH